MFPRGPSGVKVLVAISENIRSCDWVLKENFCAFDIEGDPGRACSIPYTGRWWAALSRLVVVVVK